MNHNPTTQLKGYNPRHVHNSYEKTIAQNEKPNAKTDQKDDGEGS